MKVIVTHDVDHVTAREHFRTLIIPKFVLRATIEYFLGYITREEAIARLRSIGVDKWQNILELLGFDKQNGIPSTFFLGVQNGKHLSYGLEAARHWVEIIENHGFDVGVHGIAYSCAEDILREFQTFSRLSEGKGFGIRMHYLRTSATSMNILSKVGYLFDSTQYALANPYRVGSMWEFPVHIMDIDIMCDGTRWQNRKLTETQVISSEIIDTAIAKGIRYFTVLFHDHYFSDSFRTWKEWYCWLVRNLKERGLEFTSYMDAIREMESSV